MKESYAGRLLKIIVVGEPGVGKSSLVGQFVHGKVSQDYHTAIGADVSIKKLDGGASISLWDMSPNSPPSNYIQTDGAIVVFDVTNRETFEKIPKYLNKLERYVVKEIPIIIAANKCNLESTISKEEYKQYENIIETSASENYNVEYAFMKLVQKNKIIISCLF